MEDWGETGGGNREDEECIARKRASGTGKWAWGVAIENFECNTMERGWGKRESVCAVGQEAGFQEKTRGGGGEKT